MDNQVVVVSSAKEVFDWIKDNGGDDILAGTDWHPAPLRRDDAEHIYMIELADGREIEFDAPDAETSVKVWEETF